MWFTETTFSCMKTRRAAVTRWEVKNPLSCHQSETSSLSLLSRDAEGASRRQSVPFSTRRIQREIHISHRGHNTHSRIPHSTGTVDLSWGKTGELRPSVSPATGNRSRLLLIEQGNQATIIRMITRSRSRWPPAVVVNTRSAPGVTVGGRLRSCGPHLKMKCTSIWGVTVKGLVQHKSH